MAAPLDSNKTIPVRFHSGAFSHFATPREARMLIRSGAGEGVGKKTKRFQVFLFEGPAFPKAGTKYVTSFRDGVRVFAFRKITNLPREIFRQVQTDVLREA